MDVKEPAVPQSSPSAPQKRTIPHGAVQARRWPTKVNKAVISGHQSDQQWPGEQQERWPVL